MDPSWVLSFPPGVSASWRAEGELTLDFADTAPFCGGGNGHSERHEPRGLSPSLWQDATKMGLSPSGQLLEETSVQAQPRGRWTLRQLPPPLPAVMLRLQYPGEVVGRLRAAVEEAALPHASARFFYCVRELLGGGLLQITASDGGRPLATLASMTSWFAMVSGELGAQPYVLSRFAYLRREDEQLVLESPRSAARLVCHDWRAAAAIYSFSAPVTVAAAAEFLSSQLSPDGVAQLAGLLFAAGMLLEAGSPGAPSEEDRADLLSWEFHDLLFHARIREGRHDAARGATCRFAGQLPAPAAIKPAAAGTTVPLNRPDLERLQSDDAPLARVMEQRRSIRQYAKDPMTVQQLGEFLFRTARVRARCEADLPTSRGPARLVLTSRPYPSGGSLFPLEVYPLVQACNGLDPGLYHYDPAGHQLEVLAAAAPQQAMLLEHAARAAGINPASIQVLLVISARFQRVAWKYAGIAYSLILKDTGGLIQNMYLAATAMGLAPCALGLGDSDAFARAIGSNYYEETSVGEFLLGRPK